MGVGAYAAVFLGGADSANLWGLGLPMWVWLPGAGIAAAGGCADLTDRSEGPRPVNLGIVTVGLVYIGVHLSRVLPEISGGAEVGRSSEPRVALVKEEQAFIDFDSDGHWLWFDISKNVKTYLLCLAILVVMTLLAKNIVRTRTGRAFQSIRDRDIAAEVMGVPEARYKMIAFATSSFYAGIAGALFACFIGKLPPETWDLILSASSSRYLIGVPAPPPSSTQCVLRVRCQSARTARTGGDQAKATARGRLWDVLISTAPGAAAYPNQHWHPLSAASSAIPRCCTAR